MKLRYHELVTWTDPVTAHPHRSPFATNWNDTLELLAKETHLLAPTGTSRNKHLVVLQVQATLRDIRIDGGLRANARLDGHGVVISFESRKGPLRFSCDTFITPSDRQLSYQANVRAIALGLEALRLVDRYGVARTGQQYTGFASIEAVNLRAPEDIIAKYSHLSVTEVKADPKRARRLALINAHPDHGGSRDDLSQVQKAAEHFRTG